MTSEVIVFCYDPLEGRLQGESISTNLFRSRNKDILFGDEEPWSTFPTSREAFEFEPLRNALTIKHDGLYLLYVQIARILFTISSLFVNDLEWLRCQHPPPSDIYDLNNLPIGRETCSMFGVRPLLASDKIRIVNGNAGLTAETTLSHCTYFGITKLE